MGEHPLIREPQFACEELLIQDRQPEAHRDAIVWRLRETVELEQVVVRGGDVFLRSLTIALPFFLEFDELDARDVPQAILTLGGAEQKEIKADHAHRPQQWVAIGKRIGHGIENRLDSRFQVLDLGSISPGMLLKEAV